MTEVDVQNALWRRYVGKSLIIAPCSMVLGWEADMIVVTRALLVHEFEIKLTHADFLADAKKDKWEMFDKWARGEKKYTEMGAWGSYRFDTQMPPTYFWYVCPPDMIQPEELKPWMGLAYIRGNYPHVVQKPTRLHKDHLDQKGLFQLCGSMNGRYWSMRMNLKRENEE